MTPIFSTPKLILQIMLSLSLEDQENYSYYIYKKSSIYGNNEW